MVDQIRTWILEHQAISFVIGLALVGAIALILAAGVFQVEISRPFASGGCTDQGDSTTCESSHAAQCENWSCHEREAGIYSCQYDSDIPNCDTSIPAGQPGGPPGDTTSTTNNQPCVPVSAASWTGGANACTPENAGLATPPVPENWLPHANLQNTSGLPSLAKTAPYGSADQGYQCFGFTLPAGNEWAGINAQEGGSASPPKRTYTLTGQYFNNCPWPVEMTGGATGSPKAGGNFIFMTDGSIDEPTVNLDSIITRNTTIEIPSCWNYAHIQGATSSANGSNGSSSSDPAPRTSFPGDDEGVPTLYDWEATPIFKISRISDYIGRFFGIRALAQTSCQGTYSIALDWGYDAGRIEASLGWKHHDDVGTGPNKTTTQDGYNIVVSGSGNCTGAGAEDCAGEGASVGGFAGGAGGPGSGGTSGISGPGPGGAFNCGTGESSNACWCGEWGDAIWAQRHTNAACQCDPGFVISADLTTPAGFRAADNPAIIGNTCATYQDWSQGEVQAFIDIMDDNFSSNAQCTPRSTGVDYAGIQDAYFAVSEQGWGLSDNGTSATARLCKDASGTEAAVLEGVCQAGPAVRLTWNIPTNSVTNAIIKRTDGGEGNFLTGIGRLQDNVTDSALEPGHIYQYQHKSHAAVASDPLNVTIEADGTCIIEGAPPVTAIVDPGTDTDGDGDPDITDPDDDNDGIPDEQEDFFPGGTSGGSSVITGGGQVVGTAATAQTGPAGATFLAFMLASVSVLLYVSYTHTSLFRRGEVNKLKDDQDSMDFRA